MERKQFVFIMTDTQGANCVGCYGNEEMGTPNIDRLAAEGLRFAQAYTTCPLCTPARGALFTGTYPHTNGAWCNEQPMGYNIKSVGQRLRDQGIHAAYVGKWHLSATDYFGDGKCPDGWDPEYWYDGRNYLDDLPEDLVTFSRQYQTPESIREAGFSEEMTYAHRCADKAIDFLETHADRDFFLVVSFDEPHHPSIAPSPFCDLYQDYEFDVGEGVYDDLSDKPAHQQHWAASIEKRRGHGDPATKRYVCPAYFACNTFVDYEIGRVVDAIDRLVPAAPVLYTSDHGEMMHSHRLFSKGPVMYEEITRIPFLVRWPSVIEAETVVDEAVSQIDVTPTVLDYFGVDCPPFLEGESLLPNLRGRKLDRLVFMEFNRHNVSSHGYGGFKPIRAVCDGRHKLVLNLLHTDELYDLDEDPAEMMNLIDSSEHAQIRDQLHAAVVDWQDRTRDPFRGPEWRYRQWSDEEVEWPGGATPRADDGYERPVLGYNTGLPH